MKIKTTINTETQHNQTLVRNQAKVKGLKIKSQVRAGWSTSGDADDRPTEEVAFYY